MVSAFRFSDSYLHAAELGMEMNGINPNMTAIVLASTCMYMQLVLEKKQVPRPLRVLLYLVTLIAVYRTRSRGTFFSFALVIFLSMFLKNRLKKSWKLLLFIMAVAVIAGLLFPFVYVGLYERNIISDNTEILGKSVFTGRQFIWINLREYLRAHVGAYLYGVGYNTDLYSTGKFNMHNAYLQLFAQFGLPILGAYLVYLFYSVRSMYGRDGKINDVQFKCCQLVLMTICIGFGETIFSYIPGMIFYAMAVGIGCREKDGGS